jgi:hypothetical protein
MILQDNNARPHTANMTQVAIQELDWEILPHPPYSTDLAPSDYHLFRSLSNNWRRVSFNNDAELRNWLDDFFTAKPVDFFKCGIENLLERWKAVVNNEGEYIISCLIICVKNELFGSVKNRTILCTNPTCLRVRF